MVDCFVNSIFLKDKNNNETTFNYLHLQYVKFVNPITLKARLSFSEYVLLFVCIFQNNLQ